MQPSTKQREKVEIVSNSIDAGKSEAPAIEPKPMSCLITDDSSLVRKIAGRVFREIGFEVDEAENGQVALEKCQIHMPDVVLLDWNMPVMDGLEFLKALRRTEGGRDPAVIFCTTETDVDHVQRALASGANEYLMKPFDKETLLGKLDMVVTRR
jgi:two-component system chemotaxis response regulator CheY